MPVTLKDVARIAGVTHQAVSLILRGGPKATLFAAATRARVVAAAAELGYRPNSQAVSIRTGMASCIGLLLDVDWQRGAFAPPMLVNLIRAAEDRGLHVATSIMKDETLLDPVGTSLLLSHIFASGLIIDCHSATVEPLRERLNTARLPAVWLNNRLAADCVYPDERGNARRLGLELVRQGAAALHLWGPGTPPEERLAHHFSHRDRWLGIADAGAEAGVPATLMAPPLELGVTQRRAELGSALRAMAPHSALVAIMPPVELEELVLGLTDERPPTGLRLGAIALGGPMTTVIPTTLSTIPWDGMATKAVAMLMDKIAAPGEPRPPILLSAALTPPH